MGDKAKLVNIYLKRINSYFNSDLLKNQLSEFIVYKLTIMNEYSNLKNFIQLLAQEDMVQMDWDSLCVLLNNFKNSERYFKKYLVEFFRYIVINKMYLGNYKEYLEENIDTLFETTYRPENRVDNIFMRERIFSNYPIHSQPDKLYRYTFQNKSTVTLNLSRNNSKYNDILVSFANYFTNIVESWIKHDTTRVFFYYFQDSLYATDKYNNDTFPFSYETFIIQYRFFKKIEDLGICKSRYYRITLILRDFYLFLYKSNSEVKESFIENGIDRYYLEQINFYFFFSKGCKVVKYSYDDQPPKIDCFLIDTVFYREKLVNTKSENYSFVNLRKIKDKRMIEVVKHWLWYGSGSVPKRASCLNRISEVLNIAHDIKTENNNCNKQYFDTHMLLLLLQELKKKKNVNNYNSYIKILRNFFRYLRENYPEMICENFELLFKVRKVRGTRLDKAISPADYKIIYSAALELKDEIFIKILTIFSNCSLRLGEILNLRVNCIVEKYDSGAGKIVTITKTSNYEKKEIIVNDKIINCIEDIIELTSKLRKENYNSDVKEYLFIKSKSRMGIGLYNQNFTRNFNKIIKENISKLSDDYTAYDLRHFYIDFVVNKYVKEGKSYSEVSSITNNSKQTFLKYYVNKYNIENYVETIGEALLDDSDIEGSITDNIEIRQIVEDNLGGCKQDNECINLEYDTCLRCNCFCTCIEKINEFERKINELKDRIEFGIGDEYENRTVLQLCMKYLVRLLEVKDEKELSR